MAVGYFKQILISAEQTVNAICGGWADECISARCYREGRLKAIKWINLMFFDKQHCFDSYVGEFERRQLPSVYDVNCYVDGKFNPLLVPSPDWVKNAPTAN